MKLSNQRVVRVRARLEKIVEALPEASFRPVLAHASLEVRGKRFGWFMVDHHSDGRVVVECKGDKAINELQVASDPAHLYIPKYGGHRGWIGYWLDVSGVDWKRVEEVVIDAYRATAPRSLTSATSGARVRKRTGKRTGKRTTKRTKA